MAGYLASFLYGNARHVSANLPKVRHILYGLFAAVHFADKTVKNFDLAGIGFLIQLMDQDAVNQLMDVLIGQLVDLCLLVDDC